MQFRTAMAFIDGENLVCRYQKMIAEGGTPQNGIKHRKDVYAWIPQVINCTAHEMLRVTYYTSATGDDLMIDTVRDEIAQLEFSHGCNSGLPTRVSPIVIKRPSDQQRSKGVDIQMAVDALTHAARRNIHTAYIVTGDGDFAPMIEEIKRCGCQVFTAALSSGLNPIIRRLGDKFVRLDHHFFNNRQ